MSNTTALIDSAGTRPAPAGSDPGDTDNPKVFVLSRELNEVHLLLDNLSANPDKCLADLEQHLPPELHKDWIQQICRINWPPSPPLEHQTEEAALLIRAKDFLNTATKPATGATIAFTLLVTQEDNPPNPGRTGQHDAPTRRSLARNAYPGLVGKAVEFRRFIAILGAVLFVLLGVTCGLSWYTAFGNATLAQRAAAQAVLDATDKRVADIENGVNGDSDKPVQSTAAAGKPATPLCATRENKPSYYTAPTLSPTFPSVAAMQACQAQYGALSSVQIIDRTLLGWLRLTSFGRVGDKPNYDNGHIELFAASVVNILGTAVLPVLYGILGAGAAVLRGISRKIKTSQLAPRDLHLSLQQLALGAVMGACISLFIAQPSSSAQQAQGLVGSIALSSSALSFVAGFGVESVFAALEAFIARIFLISSGTTPQKG